MEFLTIIRNNRQRDELIERVRSMRLPFKSFNQPVYPDRSPGFNAYYWGVVVKMIADHTGQEPEAVHDHFRKKFNVEYYMNKRGIWVFRTKSTSELDTRTFEDFVEKVVADATIELRINFPFPIEMPIN